MSYKNQFRLLRKNDHYKHSLSSNIVSLKLERGVT